MFVDFWDYVLNPVFLITVGILLIPFAALAWSVWVTWQEDDKIGH